jgi:hypothetical protein
VDTQAIQNTGIPLLFDAELNFVIRATGQYANVVREITAVTYDYDNLTERFIALMDKEEKDKNSGATGPGSGATPTDQGTTGTTPQTDQNGSQPSAIKMPKGRPTIVYWEEN